MEYVTDGLSALFQFTPLREGRQLVRTITALSDSFNSRPCVRGDLFFGLEVTINSWCFNSRPCVRGDALKLEDLQAEIVSIHAPA